MSHSFSGHVFVYGYPGFYTQLFERKDDSFVEMKKPVLDVVPEEFDIKAVGHCRLSALVAEFALELVVAVFAGCCHVLNLLVCYFSV
jgi:hypothetical protein